MEILIWILIIIAIIAKAKKSGNASGRQPNRSSQPRYSAKPNQPGYGRQPGYSAKPNQPNYNAKPNQPSYGTQPNRAQYNAQPNRANQEELKRRLEQKYGTRATQPNQSGYGTQENMSRQPNYGTQPNMSNQSSYGAQRNMSSQPGYGMQRNMSNQPGYNVQPKDILHRATENVAEFEQDDMVANTEFMKQVNDLMIMGYSTKLSYERDFVAEGVEMINRFDVPQTNLPELQFGGLEF